VCLKTGLLLRVGVGVNFFRLEACPIPTKSTTRRTGLVPDFGPSPPDPTSRIPDFGPPQILVAAAGQLPDFGRQRIGFEPRELLREAGRQHLGFRKAVEESDGHRGQQPAGIDRFAGAVGRARGPGGFADGGDRVAGEAHRHRREFHDRAVAGAAGIGGARHGVAGFAVADQRAPDGVADVEAGAGDRVGAVAPPRVVAFDLVGGIRAVAGEQAVGQAQGHRGVVGPLPGLQAEGAAADNAGDRRKRAARFELHGRAERVAGGQPEQGAAKTVAVHELMGREVECRDRNVMRRRGRCPTYRDAAEVGASPIR
jgi:hypothetical protein